MASNFAIPFGPTARPGHMVTGCSFFDDFIGTSLSATDDAAVWDLQLDSGSTAVIAVDEPNGVLSLSPNEIGLDANVELNGEPFQFERLKDAIFETRLKISSIATDTADCLVGLCETSPDLASGSAGAIEKNLIGFFLGEADIKAITGDGTSETIDDTTSDLVADTYVVLTWKWHAKSETLRFYVDGDRKVTQSVADGDRIPADATNLTIVIVCEQHAGTTANGVTLDVDYVLYAKER